MIKQEELRINIDRLVGSLRQLGDIGALAGGGVCRLALTDEDKAGRDLLSTWMRELDLDIKTDELGNMVGIRKGRQSVPPVLIGSHLDTVGTGGLYDGSLGVLAGLEIMRILDEFQIATERPLAIANFTNEEGVRFTPDMMGSLAFSGIVAASEMLSAKTVDGSGKTVGEELTRIGYAGAIPCGTFEVDSFLELHIEQGPLLEEEGVDIGAVSMVQGIYWTEYQFTGSSNHAGTTPLHLRRDAGLVAAATATFVRQLALKMGGDQVGTVGLIELFPNLINVMAERARIIVDLRNTDAQALAQAQQLLEAEIELLAAAEKIAFEKTELVRFPPVQFDREIVAVIEKVSEDLGYSHKKMPSGAGHDAQMLAPICPTAMIFVPSVGGISHNIEEFTKRSDIEKGANVLLQAALRLLNRPLD